MVNQGGSSLLSLRPLEPSGVDDSLLAELNADPKVIDFLGEVIYLRHFHQTDK